MSKVLQSVVLAAISVSICANAAHAEGDRADKYLESAQQAYDSGDFAKAETGFARALKELDSQGATSNEKYATVLKRLAQSCRKNQDFGDAGQYLNKAISVCKAIGLNDQEINQEYAELSKQCKIVDLDRLGLGSANTLKSNSATITISKAGSGHAVRIVSPARFETPHLNSDKIDQMAVEKECTFNLTEEADGTVKATDIKGFKIHSVEKGMWVNLFGCTFGPVNAAGQHESVISAGKMGVVKNVNSTIQPRTYEPVGGIVEAMRNMDQPGNPPLPIASTPATPPPVEQVPTAQKPEPTKPAATGWESAGASAANKSDNSSSSDAVVRMEEKPISAVVEKQPEPKPVRFEAPAQQKREEIMPAVTEKNETPSVEPRKEASTFKREEEKRNNAPQAVSERPRQDRDDEDDDRDEDRDEVGRRESSERGVQALPSRPKHHDDDDDNDNDGDDRDRD